MNKHVVRKTFLEEHELETVTAKDIISELADDLEEIGHTGKNIFEWFVDEAIQRDKKDPFCAPQSHLKRLAMSWGL